MLIILDVHTILLVFEIPIYNMVAQFGVCIECRESRES